MNYIAQINLFRALIKTTDMTPSAINLYYALLAINNSCGWREAFNVAISTLESECRYSRSEIYRARECLISLGLIKVEERAGNRSAVYSIIPLYVEGEVKKFRSV